MQQSFIPSHTTSFVGREDDIAEIVNLLADPNCRLLTLVGPGGIGKTRLAIEAVPYLKERYFDGVLFVDLTPVNSPDAILLAIASTASLSRGTQAQSSEDLSSEILSYFQDKQLLLILDNFEHVLDGAEHVITLLDVAPDLQIMVTSREVLNLQSEWVRSIEGLPYSSNTQSDHPDQFESVQLFVERARQYQRDFSLDTEKAHVVRICQLTDGMPLAIELSATWLKTLSCEGIVQEIQDNLDFLASNLRDIPERHRSIRAIFDHTWQRLSKDEQLVLARLSVFRGGFTQEAFEDIASGTLHILASLADRSLIRSTSVGRYNLHELLRQYADDQLHLMGAIDATRDTHSRYYLKLLAEREIEISCGWSQNVIADIDNLQLAWHWAVARGYYDEIRQATVSFYMLHRHLGRFTDVTSIYQTTLNHVKQGEVNDSQQLAYGYLLSFWSHAAPDIQSQDKTQAFLQSINLLKQMNAQREWAIATLLYLDGAFGYGYDRDLIYEQLQKILTTFRELNDRLFVLHTVGRIARLLIIYNKKKQFEEVKLYLEEALTIGEELGDRRYGVQAIHELGQFHFQLGAYDLAHQYLQESLAIYVETNNRLGIMASLGWLGHTAVVQQKYEEGRRYFQDELTLAQDLNIVPHIGWALHDLGRLAFLQEDYQHAHTFFIRSMKYALYLLQKLAFCAGLISVQAFMAPNGTILERLSLVLNSPVTPSLTAKMAEMARVHLETSLPADVYEQAWERGKSLDIEETFEHLLSSVSEEDLSYSSSIQITVTTVNQDLPDPLTDRELEILYLIADGYSNKEICDHLVLSKNTVRSHLKHLYSKLAVDSRTRAVATARDLGLL